jgi:hypothetical protein
MVNPLSWRCDAVTRSASSQVAKRKTARRLRDERFEARLIPLYPVRLPRLASRRATPSGRATTFGDADTADLLAHLACRQQLWVVESHNPQPSRFSLRATLASEGQLPFTRPCAAIRTQHLGSGGGIASDLQDRIEIWVNEGGTEDDLER